MKKINKGGRPKFEIDYNYARRLCKMHCTGEELADALGCCYDTLNRALKRDGHGGFAEYYKKASAGGNISLRRAQWKYALKGNTALLIFLGKNWLDQKDKPGESEAQDNIGEALKELADKLPV
jgi:IS30 family transposase